MPTPTPAIDPLNTIVTNTISVIGGTPCVFFNNSDYEALILTLTFLFFVIISYAVVCITTFIQQQLKREKKPLSTKSKK